jgi:hypothetical protein
MPETALQIDLTDWIPKDEAARFLGVSMRTLTRAMAAGEIRTADSQPAPGHKQRTLCHPEDLRRIDAERRGAKPVVRRGNNDATTELATEQRRAAAWELLPKGIEAATDALAALARPRRWRPFLTLAEAAEYSGLPQAFLKRSELRRKVGGRVLFRRADLDDLAGLGPYPGA